MNISNEDLESIKNANTDETVSDVLVKLQQQYLNKGFLTAKQVRFAGSVLKQTFQDEFKINGTDSGNYQEKKEKKETN